MTLGTCAECGHRASSKAAACPACGAPQKAKTSLTTWLVAILLGLGVIGAMSGDRTVQASIESDDPEAAALVTTSLDFSWKKAGFGNIMTADFIVTNAGQRAVKDLDVSCDHFAASGTRIDSSKRTLFHSVAAGETKRFPGFNMGFVDPQSTSSRCRITRVRL